MPTASHRSLRQRLTWSALASLFLLFLSSTSMLSTESQPKRGFSLELNELLFSDPAWSLGAVFPQAFPEAASYHFPARPAAIDTPTAFSLPHQATAVPTSDYVLTLPFGREIEDAARRYDVDALLLASIVEAESSFRADAVSPKGALGLMQLMPLHFDGTEEPLDPQINLDLGARYLETLQTRFDGDVELALAAYNAGPGAVERFGGLPPWRETQKYIDRVMSIYREHQEHAAEVAGASAKLAT